MEETKKEIYINSSPEPVSLKGTEEIANQMKIVYVKYIITVMGQDFLQKFHINRNYYQY